MMSTCANTFTPLRDTTTESEKLSRAGKVAIKEHVTKENDAQQHAHVPVDFPVERTCIHSFIYY